MHDDERCPCLSGDTYGACCGRYHSGTATAPTAEALIAHAALSLARFKCPTVVELVDALPHSATGKVSKGRLRELAG